MHCAEIRADASVASRLSQNSVAQGFILERVMLYASGRMSVLRIFSFSRRVRGQKKQLTDVVFKVLHRYSVRHAFV